MSLPQELVTKASNWLEERSPFNNAVISSRARYARNLHEHPFSPHASPSLMEKVREEITDAFTRSRELHDFYCVELTEASGTERGFLKESRLISKEMERGGPSRAVYVSSDLKSSVMVNEEDHLRLQCLESGLQISKAQEDLSHVDQLISRVVGYAFHEKLGYLTACPTNVGTGLRASVMMHLPGLALRRNVEAAFQGLAHRGLTVRGFHGENSENLGDFFQISNEVTLGKSVEEIEETLADAVNGILEREFEARSLLLSKGGTAVQDTIWRSFGVLLHARKIDTAEAMKLLSRVRLGIDEGYFPSLTHETLNKLVMEIQPSHLVLRHQAADEVEQRDIARATLIREVLGGPSGNSRKSS
jgi:protein arginine kinase